MEPKESTKKGRNKSATVINSKRSSYCMEEQEWVSSLLSPLAKDRLRSPSKVTVTRQKSW